MKRALRAPQDTADDLLQRLATQPVVSHVEDGLEIEGPAPTYRLSPATQRKLDVYLAVLRGCASKPYAAEQAGISLNYLAKLRSKVPALREAEERAMLYVSGRVRVELMRKALVERNVRALIYLDNRLSQDTY